MRRQTRIEAYELHPIERRVFEPLGGLPGQRTLLEELVRAERLRVEAVAAVDRAARACRVSHDRRYPPYTFERIAEVLGISKQAAAKRYGEV